MHFDFPRPIQTSSDVQPIIQTPGHGSWPSGHATEAFAVAQVFSALQAGGRVDALSAVAARSHPMRLAARIATNRTIAGVHYPSDSMAGAILGLGIGEMVVNWLSGDADTPIRQFNGTGFLDDFSLETLEGILPSAGMVSFVDAPSPVLSNLWQVAKDEWVR